MSSSTAWAMRMSGNRHPDREAQRWGRGLVNGLGIDSHLQPIVDLRLATIVGHEALIRGAESQSLRSPDDLFRAVRAAGLMLEFEHTCVRSALAAWSREHRPGLLFVNLSTSALLQLVEHGGASGFLDPVSRHGAEPTSIVIEVTEHDSVSDLPAMLALAQDLRRKGVRFALGDFGDGRSSLRLWAELRPDFVKVDKYFVRDIDTEAVKVQTLRGLLGFAELFGTKVIAEGIETESELLALRDLGVNLGQGYLLGRPTARASTSLHDSLASVMKSRHIAVLPEARRLTGRDFTIGRLSERVPPIDSTCTVEHAAEHFADNENLRAVALVKGTQVRGLLTRRHFFDQRFPVNAEFVQGFCIIFRDNVFHPQQTINTRR